MMERLADKVAAALKEKGWCVVDKALPDSLATALALECSHGNDTFRPAGTGRQNFHQRDRTVRSDAIRWVDATLEAGGAYLKAMETFRSELNSRLYLGLFDYECHYARYVPGAFYGRHVDAFAGEKNRILSTVLYFNEHWEAEEGGELLLYDGEATVETILPHHNRFVIFLSERFPHEVKPATRERHSIAGWFRVRA
jgi:SM-20-related protein